MIGVNVKFTIESLKKFAEIEKQLNLLAKWKLVVQFNEDNTEENGQKVELIAMWLGMRDLMFIILLVHFGEQQ